MKLPNGFGSIFTEKRQGRRRRYRAVLPAVYVLATNPDGSEQLDKNGLIKYIAKRETLGWFNTRKEALNALSEYHKNPIKKTDIILSELFEEWKKYKFENISESSKRSYCISYQKLQPYYNTKITDIPLQGIQNIIDGLQLSYMSKSKIKTLMVSLFDYAIRVGYSSINPFAYLNTGKSETHIKRTVFTPSEIQHLWNNSTNIYAQYFLVLLYTGMRKMEFATISTINLQEHYMVGGSKTKAGKNRIIPLHKDIEPIIGNFIQYTQNMQIKKLSFPEPAISWLRKQGMCHTIHDTRYTFITRMEEIGIPLITTQKIVGHISGTITLDLYTKLQTSELVNSINRLDYGVQPACNIHENQ